MNFVTGPGTKLKRIPGIGAFHLIRNKSAQNGVYVNGLTVSSGKFTMPEPGHSRSVGDQVYVAGFLTNTALNGLKTVTAVTPGVSWAFAASGVAPTNTSGQLAFAATYNPLAAGSFVRASNVVTVTEAGHTRGIGDHIWIEGLATDTTFNGAHEITGVTTGVSWTYSSTGSNGSPTGTAQLLGDRNINIEVELDGNIDNVTSNGWGCHGAVFINCSNSSATIRDSKNMRYGRTLAGFNVSDFRAPYTHASSNCGVGVQFDGSCDRVFVGVAEGLGYFDDVLAWGVTSAAGPFGDTTSPCGPGDMGTLVVDTVQGKSPSGLFKCYATTGYDLGSMSIGRIKGNGPVSLGDSTAGVSGGTFKSLVIGECDNTPDINGSQLNCGFSNAFSAMGKIRVGIFNDNAPSISSTGYTFAVGSPLTTLEFGAFCATKDRTVGGFTIGALIQSPIGLLSFGSLETAGGANLNIFYFSTGGVVDSVRVGTWKHKGAADSSIAFSENGGGYIKSLAIDNFVVDTIGKIFGGATAGQTHNIYLSNGEIITAASGVGTDATGTFNIFLNNVNCLAFDNNLLQFYLAGQTVRAIGYGLVCPVGRYALMSGAHTISVNGADFKIDLGANGGSPPATLAPQVGDQVWNSNATGTGLYGRTAAGAWAKIF